MTDHKYNHGKKGMESGNKKGMESGHNKGKMSYGDSYSHGPGKASAKKEHQEHPGAGAY